MTEPLKRSDIIELLNRLGSDADEDVLEAARQVHARIAEAGVTWDVLLVPDGAGEDVGDDDIEDDDPGDDDIDDDDTDDDTDDGDTDDGDTDDGNTDDDDTDDDDTDDDDTDDDDEAPAGKSGNFADSRKLIDKLLARKGISADLREELKGYKTDIAEGEFTEADRRYLDALNKRLSK